MSASIQFLGGTGTVTGSKFLLHTGRANVLVDCGLFQGIKELRLQNWQPLPYDVSKIDAVLLTHAHLDHSGYLPLLVKNGFKGPIYCTAPTRELVRVILLDSAKIQEEDAELANAGGYSKHSPAKPLYTVEDAHQALRQLRTVPLQWTEEAGIKFNYANSGHILGSAWIQVETQDGVVGFTGDLGRAEPMLMNPPQWMKTADILLVESTYGDRAHSPISPLKELGRIIRETHERGGHVVIPSFAVGRTQDVLYLISQLKKQAQIPEIPIFLDSPMGINATEIFLDYPEWHRLTPDEVKDLCRCVTLVKSQQQSRELLARKESSIVIAGSGMLTGGRVLVHLDKRLPDERNSVVLVGFQSASTRGSLLRSGISELKIYGKYVPVRAKIEEISSLSAHADQKDILKWLGHLGAAPRTIFIVHGEAQASDALRVKIRDELGWSCTIPKPLQKYNLMPPFTPLRE